MDQTTPNPGHRVPALTRSVQICAWCGGVSQTPDTLAPDEGEPLPLWQMSQKLQPRPRFRASSILLGLLPLLLFSSACLLLISEGRCQPHTGSALLALLSLALWGIEVIGGILCLFHGRLRTLAAPLLITLMLSVAPGCLALFPSFLGTFCMHMVF